jgi:hypothetical protein
MQHPSDVDDVRFAERYQQRGDAGHPHSSGRHLRPRVTRQLATALHPSQGDLSDWEESHATSDQPTC